MTVIETVTSGHSPALLGIDVGTTHIKAVVFDERGAERARWIVDTPAQTGEAGRVDWDPEAIWRSVGEATRKALETFDASGGARAEVAGVAVASVGESGVALDREGRAVGPIIAWFDLRTEPQMAWWAREVGLERTRAIAGVSIRALYSALKILWMLEHVDGFRERADVWLPVSDFIAFKLTGKRATDFSQASRTMLFDQASLKWSDELLAASGIPRSLLPEPVPAGTLLGRVSREASEATGIPAGVPVFVGGHDHVCGALAAGVVAPGVLLDSCGTAESILVPCADGTLAGRVCKNGFSFGHHVVKGMHYAMGGLLASGGAVEWFIREFCSDDPSYGGFSELAAGAAPCSNGVVFVPRLFGSGPPTRDERAAGAFARVRAHATKADFARAVLEGVSFELRRAVAAMEAAIGQRVSRVVAIGGGAKNELWLSIKAAAIGLPIEVPGAAEAVALGAAMLAGIGCGLFEDAQDALSKIVRPSRTIQPDEDLVRLYQDAYVVYTRVSDALHDVDVVLAEERARSERAQRGQRA